MLRKYLVVLMEFFFVLIFHSFNVGSSFTCFSHISQSLPLNVLFFGIFVTISTYWTIKCHLLHCSYGGPDSALVTKQWSIGWGTSLVSRLGVAVAHIDGRGSGLRGVANTFTLNRQLGTVEIEDQINVTRSVDVYNILHYLYILVVKQVSTKVSILLWFVDVADTYTV